MFRAKMWMESPQGSILLEERERPRQSRRNCTPGRKAKRGCQGRRAGALEGEGTPQRGGLGFLEGQKRGWVRPRGGLWGLGGETLGPGQVS